MLHQINMIQYKKFLIPIDFSEHSRVAAQQGVSLAQRHQAKVYFLHVGENSQQAAQRLSEFINAMQFENSLDSKKLVAQGSPSSVILSVARKTGANMIVMGSRGMSGLKHFVYGSVAEEVLREANCPVLVIKRRKQTGFASYVMPQIRKLEGTLQVDKILVPLDFSPASKLAFQHAVAVAANYSSTIYTLTVFEKKLKEYGDDSEEHTTLVIRGEKVRLWEEFPALLASAGYSLGHSRLKRMLLAGEAAAKIESVVDKKEIDLIIMGTNGRTGLEHLFIGSVAEKVLRAVNCAVMTIRS